jgi:hypothetical protein
VTTKWVETFARAIGRIDYNLDAPRIEEAFKKFETIGRKWPCPAVVIDLMPRRPEMERIDYDPRNSEQNNSGLRLSDMFDKILEKSHIFDKDIPF